MLLQIRPKAFCFRVVNPIRLNIEGLLNPYAHGDCWEHHLSISQLEIGWLHDESGSCEPGLLTTLVPAKPDFWQWDVYTNQLTIQMWSDHHFQHGGITTYFYVGSVIGDWCFMISRQIIYDWIYQGLANSPGNHHKQSSQNHHGLWAINIYEPSI